MKDQTANELKRARRILWQYIQELRLLQVTGKATEPDMLLQLEDYLRELQYDLAILLEKEGHETI